MKINIMGADAERRQGLKTLLRRVARQAQYQEVTDWNQAHAAQSRSRPDMIVIDWAQELHPLELQTLLRENPGLPAAVMIDQPAVTQVYMLMSAGATGVIPRTLDPVLVLRALEMVMIGGHFVPPDIIDPQLGRELARRGAGKPLPARRIRTDLDLSPRQQQIMRCVHMGCTNKTIARMLGISEGTVKIHLTSVFQQLGATNRAAAVAIYNGVQDSHLEILREEEDLPETGTTEQATPDDIATASNIVPLPARHASYPLVNGDDAPPLPIAAQPDAPF
jgi:DNA-binding NarL/FixJ family response regulator